MPRQYDPSIVDLSALQGAPFVTVSPTGGGAIPNNGANFGPDTPGTTTCGIQEALNSLRAITVIDPNGNNVAGRTGWVQLLGSIFSVTSTITIPPGSIRLRGIAKPSWLSVLNITPAQDVGGTAIVGAAALLNVGANGVISCPQDSHGVPATQLDFGDMDVRVVSPGSVGGYSTPDVIDLSGWLTGTVSNLTVAEVATGGGIGHNGYVMFDGDWGASCDDHIVENVYGVGGHTGVHLGGAHLHARNIQGGFTGSGIDAYDRGIQIDQNIDQTFQNLHAFSTTYGLEIAMYSFSDPPFDTLVIDGCHFESVTHYIGCAYNNQTGTCFIRRPAWDQANPTPSTDVAAVLASASNTYSISAQAGIAIITSDEKDIHNMGTGRHVTVPPASLVAGASPYTFPTQQFDAVYICTAVGGMTGLTLDGQAVSLSVLIPIFVAANHTLIATWSVTAPTFRIIPQ